jgi:hypothetical protein
MFGAGQGENERAAAGALQSKQSGEPRKDEGEIKKEEAR